MCVLAAALLWLSFSGHVAAAAATTAPSPGTERTALNGTTADHQLYVDHTATGTGDGLSWQNAFRNLQDALSLARTLAPASSVEIWVAQGVYFPDVGSGMTNNSRLHAFEFGSRIALYGGFSGVETTRDERDWLAHPTVLSGDIDGNDDTDANGVALSHTDINGANSYHVVRITQATEGTVLDGFSISSGQATGGGLIGGTFLMRYGAGVYLRSGNARLANLRIQGNVATMTNGAGAGLYTETDSGVSNTIVMNDVHIVGNAAAFGGGMHVRRTRIDANALRIQHNQASSGGALYGNLTPSMTFRDSVFAGNSAVNGGAIHGFRDSIALVNCLITGNHASGNGGGYYSGGAPSLDLQIVLTNVVVSGNRAEIDGGGIYRHQPSAGGTRLWNTIVWNNQDSSGLGTAAANHGGPGAARLNAVNSLVQGLNPAGAGNLDGTLVENDPQFRDPADPSAAPAVGGNYRLLAASPVIDRGENLARINPFNQAAIPLEGNVLFDLDGNARIADGNNDLLAVVDLGPYEGPTFTIGGNVSGLLGTGLVLHNNGEDLAIVSDGPFTFNTVVSDLDTYSVTVAASPTLPSQTCTVLDGNGSVNGADVTTVQIACTTDEFVVTPLAGIGGSIAPSLPQSVPSNESIDFNLTAEAGYDLGAVAGSCGGNLDLDVFTIFPVTADCTVEAVFVPRTSSVLSIASNPVRIGEPVEFIVEVEGIGSAPIDGRIDVSADSGEACADTDAPEITGLVARFACSISFNTLGERDVAASFSASSSHSGSDAPAIPVVVKRYADVSVGIDDGSPISQPGSSVAYLIELRNNGPDPAPNTMLIIAADPALIDAGWQCTPVGGATCPENMGIGELMISADLPSGSGLDFIQEGTLPPSIPGTVVVQALATVSGDAPDEVFDPNLANNAAMDVNIVPDEIFADDFELPLDDSELQMHGSAH